MVVEVHWWIKEIASGIRGTHRGIDYITERNIENFRELLYGCGIQQTIELADITPADLMSVMDELGEFGHEMGDSKEESAMINFSDILHYHVIIPDTWGIKCLKFKKDKDSKRAFKVIKD